MNYYLIGTDYRTTPLKVREEIYLRRKEIVDLWQRRGPNKAVVLWTCNRMEIYGFAHEVTEFLIELNAFRKCFSGLFNNAYFRFGQEEVFRHGLRLACGLESQLLGEIQILQQLKAWVTQDYFPSPLAELWGRILSSAKDIRNQSGLNREEINIANIIFADLNKRVNSIGEIIVLGTGKIAELIARYRPEDTRLHFISHKNRGRAQLLAQRAKGTVENISDLPRLLLTADVLLSATSSPHYVLYERHFSGLMNKRRRPVHIYDLAIPRDIEPEVRYSEGIILQDLNDLGQIINRDNLSRTKDIRFAEYLVEEAVRREFDGQYHQDRHTPQQVGNPAG